MRQLRSALLAAAIAAAGCASAQQPPPVRNELGPRAEAAANAGPVRNLAMVPGEEIVTLRYWKIRKGAFPEFLKASQEGVWPYFEKIGARIVGMWMVTPAPGTEGPADYDEVYLMTRYASLEHWAATRSASALGGDGPDYAALQAALAVRDSLATETRLTFLSGFTGPNGPYFMPGTGERFAPLP
jgi:hypothetical protein